jgi:glucan endo-1,3-alpha-glucosidase
VDHFLCRLFLRHYKVSGYSGDDFPWDTVISALTAKNSIALMPNFHTLTTYNTKSSMVSGGLSWYAWPTDGQNGPAKVPMTTDWDKQYRSAIGNDKAYIAPIGA